MASRPYLGLVPLDAVDPHLLNDLKGAIAALLCLPVRLSPSKPLPPHTHHLIRNQHHSTGLLEYLLEDETGNPWRILGVTTVDLYIPIFTFVFGEAQLSGKAAVISTFRPGGGAGEPRPARAHLLERLVKLGVHELGHTFGLGHCRQPGCLMGFSANLKKLDQKKLEFCPYCQVLLRDSLNAEDYFSY